MVYSSKSILASKIKSNNYISEVSAHTHMDAYHPHPPIDIIVFMFQSFVRIYFTTTNPIDFLANLPADQIILAFKQHSLQARHTLYQIYRLFFPLVAPNLYHQQILETAYKGAIQMIHIKLGTTPLTPTNRQRRRI